MKIVLELKQVRFKLKYCIEIAFLFTISGNQVEVKRVILKCIYLIPILADKSRSIAIKHQTRFRHYKEHKKNKYNLTISSFFSLINKILNISLIKIYKIV